jgi:uncharacterized protein YPO0396
VDGARWQSRAEAAEAKLRKVEQELHEQRVIGHGEGQEHAIADVNAGLVDDLIAPRLDALAAENQQLKAEVERLQTKCAADEAPLFEVRQEPSR